MVLKAVFCDLITCGQTRQFFFSKVSYGHKGCIKRKCKTSNIVKYLK